MGEALDNLITHADMRVLTEANQKTLRPEDRAASVEIGAEPRYHLAIHR